MDVQQPLVFTPGAELMCDGFVLSCNVGGMQCKRR